MKADERFQTCVQHRASHGSASHGIGPVEHHEAHVTELRLNRMDQTLSEMNEALAGCERIRFTPVPFAYAQHIKVFLALFCYTAPFAMVHGMRGARVRIKKSRVRTASV